MKLRHLIVAATMFAASVSQAEDSIPNPNPFARPSISITGGGYLMGFSLLGGSIAFDAAFPVAGSPDESGGFVFAMGPRLVTNVSRYDLGGSFRGNAVSNEFGMTLKMNWTFAVGSGFIAPYLDVRPAFEIHYVAGVWPGFGTSVAFGVQHHFSRHFGWRMEIEGGISVPWLIIPLPFGYGAIRAGFVYAF